MIIAPLIKSFCFLIWFFADGNIYLYALGFLFWSIGSSFVSGTSEALLYDHILELVDLPILYFGLVGTIYFIVRAIGSNYAYKLKNKKRIFQLFPLVGGLLLLIIGIFPSIPMIIVLIFTYMLATPLITLNDARIQHNIESQSRATTTSVGISLMNLFGISIIIGSGIISKIWNLEAIYIATGIFLIIFSIWSFANKKIFTNN